MGGELLERGEELGRIAAAIEDPGRAVVVEGEGGIGRSALLVAAAELARDAGARVFTARGDVLERGFDHGMTRQLFEGPVRAAQTSQRLRWLAGAAGQVAPLLGLEARSDGEDAALVQHGLYWLVLHLAAEGPLVLVIDDLQWADPASLHWLVYLARRLGGLPVVLLAGWRVGEPHAPQELVDALGAEHVALRPLSVPAAGTLVGRALERDCDRRTAEACHLCTGGNPLLLSRLMRALEAGIELPVDTARIAALGGRAVAPYVRGRLARLPAPASAVAAAAAVLEDDVAPRQLAALTGLAFGDVREACDGLVAARLLTGQERLGFAHPVVRCAIYDALSPARRARAHRAAADVLDAEGRLDRAAVHLVLAERTGDHGVVARLMAAAERSMARGVPDEAIVRLSRALEEPPEAAARYELLMALAHAEWLAGDEAAIDHAHAALEVAANPTEREEAASLLARLLSLAGRRQQALDVLARVADELRGASPDRAARLEVERLSWLPMLLLEPRGIAQNASSLAAQMPPGGLHARILTATAAVDGAATGALPAASAADMALGALADGRLLVDPSAAFYRPVAALGHCERLDDCGLWIERRRQHAARGGSRIEGPILAAYRAWVAWLRGDLPTAIEDARDALAETEDCGFALLAKLAAAPLAAALVEQDGLDEAEGLLRHHDISDGITWASCIVTAARIRIALARGDVQGALDELALAPSECASLPLQFAPCQVAVALARGATDEAREWATAMLNAAECFGAPGARGIAQRLLGLATGGADGLELLRAAIESLEHSPRRLELARAVVDYGAALRRAKHRAAAREPLRRGLDLAERCGATRLAQHAADELRATGARPRRQLLTGVASLTPSELRVARLVAQGYSNPQVARALFVTRSTVETHLQATFRKLDISRREQLAAELTG